MSSHQPLTRSSSTPSFDERQWVIKIRDTLGEEEELEQDIRIPVSVFAVPEPLLACKPEAYSPQLFAIGPYHHWQPRLYEMERYKLATVRRTQKQLRGVTWDQLVETFAGQEGMIRAHYHRYLDYCGETLAWMMAIDASFVLEFLRNYADPEGKVYRKVPSMSHMVDSARIKLSYNLILRDVVMQENQIPLFLVRDILCLQSTSTQVADDELSKMLIGFVKEVSPFKSVESFSTVDVTEHAHLLALLYRMIVPKPKELKGASEAHGVEEHNNALELEEAENSDPGYVKKSFKSIWNFASGLNVSPPINCIKRVMKARPLQFLVKIISSPPGISLVKGPIVSLFSSQGDGKVQDQDSNSSNKPPLVEEIMIPSATELTRAGVKFKPANGDLTTIQFNVNTSTLYLPTVSLDVNAEVLLRNLVAYETSVESGPVVFTRYTELINGIIDTEEDVRLLRESGIILNRLKNDAEVANLWNGMSKSVRLTSVPFIDKAIEDVNKYYNMCWSVRSRRFMIKYVLGSWQFLAFLAAILLLLLTAIEDFCLLYSCSGHWYGSTTNAAN